jgi:hypothetical protein
MRRGASPFCKLVPRLICMCMEGMKEVEEEYYDYYVGFK